MKGRDDEQKAGGRVPREWDGRRLEEVLAEFLPAASRSELARLVKRGAVRVDGQRVWRTNSKLRGGSRVVVGKPVEKRARKASGEARAGGRLAFVAEDLRVLFEDEHVVVVDKPAGLLCHAKEVARPAAVLDRGRRRGAGGLAARRKGGELRREVAAGGQRASAPLNQSTGGAGEPTLASLAVERFGRLPLLLGEHRPGIVHRLDRETSGLVVLARSGEAMEGLREAFRERRVEKAYLALVHGEPTWEAQTLDWDLVEGKGDRRGWRERGAAPGRDDGVRQAARTDVEVLERFGRAALVLCHPESGRRHQIRVHLCAAGHPIVGDALYASRGQRGELRAKRHMLHAAGLAFDHPVTGERMEGEAPPPEDMQAWIERLADEG